LKIVYHFDSMREEVPGWFWQVQDNRYTRADDELVRQAAEKIVGAVNQQEVITRLVTWAAELFGYGHGDGRFNDGMDTVPCLCGTTRGTCVDINTYIMAAAYSLDITVQYVAGYWFGPKRRTTPGMHCWLVFLYNDEPLYWDLAHHLKYGVNELAPGLNPAGGRRFAMSCGRGLEFMIPYGPVTISHFTDPVWVLPGTENRRAGYTVTLEE
jgi:hypothetical protein